MVTAEKALVVGLTSGETVKRPAPLTSVRLALPRVVRETLADETSLPKLIGVNAIPPRNRKERRLELQGPVRAPGDLVSGKAIRVVGDHFPTALKIESRDLLPPPFRRVQYEPPMTREYFQYVRSGKPPSKEDRDAEAEFEAKRKAAADLEQSRPVKKAAVSSKAICWRCGKLKSDCGH